MINLYELKKGDKIFEETSDGGKVITFDHLDGMYSYCTTDNGGVIHLSAMTTLEKVEGEYKIIIKSK